MKIVESLIKLVLRKNKFKSFKPNGKGNGGKLKDMVSMEIIIVTTRNHEMKN